MSVYQVMPDLPPEDYEALKADIALRGVLVPVEKDEMGNILDGHHRVRACEELGRDDYPVVVRSGMSEAEKRVHALALNIYRRQLDRDSRAPILAQLRAQGMSYRAIAEVAGVSEGTVRNDVKSTAQSCAVDQPERIVGKDGKSRPASRPVSVFATSPAQAQAVMDMVAESPEVIGRMAGTVTAREVASAVHSEKIAAIKESHARLPKAGEGRASLRHTDAGRFLADLPERSADLLLTDPPYSTDVEDVEAFAHSWLPLALSRVRSTGRAYVCIGAYPDELQAYLTAPRAGFALEQVLVWTYRNTLGPSPAHLYKLNWQAVLYFVGPDAPPLDCPVMVEQFSVQDISAPDGRQGNRYHSWQKPDELAERFIRHSTTPGALVIDPFACTGTFVAAAARLGRIGMGCDIDAAALEIAAARGVDILT